MFDRCEGCTSPDFCPIPPDGPLEEFVGDYTSEPALTPLFLLHNPARNELLLDVALDRIGLRRPPELLLDHAVVEDCSLEARRHVVVKERL